jgi:hypothetical protein
MNGRAGQGSRALKGTGLGAGRSSATKQSTTVMLVRLTLWCVLLLPVENTLSCRVKVLRTPNVSIVNERTAVPKPLVHARSHRAGLTFFVTRMRRSRRARRPASVASDLMSAPADRCEILQLSESLVGLELDSPLRSSFALTSASRSTSLSRFMRLVCS